MKTITQKLLFFLILGLAISLNAQNPFDCIDAIEVCDDAQIMIQYDDPFQGLVLEDFTSGCFPDYLDSTFFENNTIWLK